MADVNRVEVPGLPVRVNQIFYCRRADGLPKFYKITKFARDQDRFNGRITVIKIGCRNGVPQPDKTYKREFWVIKKQFHMLMYGMDALVPWNGDLAAAEAAYEEYKPRLTEEELHRRWGNIRRVDWEKRREKEISSKGIYQEEDVYMTEPDANGKRQFYKIRDRTHKLCIVDKLQIDAHGNPTSRVDEGMGHRVKKNQHGLYNATVGQLQHASTGLMTKKAAS